MFGHSCHFRRCPDMMHRTLFRKMVPMVFGCCLFEVLIVVRRQTHMWEFCTPLFEVAAIPWQLFTQLYSSLGGVFLLVCVFLNSDEEEVVVLADVHGHQDHAASAHGHGGAHDGHEGHAASHHGPGAVEKLASLLDYDSVLILLSFSISVLYTACQVFEAEAASLHVTSVGFVSQFLPPLGLVTFALKAMNRPPYRGGFMGGALWFSFFFAVTLFMLFQDAEDCHIASGTPACCLYPGYEEWNQHHHRKMMCNRSRRCLQKNKHKATDLWCALPDHGHGHGEDAGVAEHIRRERLLAPQEEDTSGSCPAPEGSHHDEQLVGSSSLSSGNSPHGAAFKPLHLTEDCCSVLEHRWKNFTKFGGANHESSVHHAELSVAFRVFESVGMAASVELYFTIIGVLLKVLLMTQHQNAEQISKLDSHHLAKNTVSGKHVVEKRRTVVANKGSADNRGGLAGADAMAGLQHAGGIEMGEVTG